MYAAYEESLDNISAFARTNHKKGDQESKENQKEKKKKRMNKKTSMMWRSQSFFLHNGTIM